jgi:hypothetical protein
LRFTDGFTAVAYNVARRRQPTMGRTWGDVLDDRIQDLEDCSGAELASIRIDLQLTINAINIIEAQRSRDEAAGSTGITGRARDEATGSTGATYGDEDNGDNDDWGDREGDDRVSEGRTLTPSKKG